MWRPMTGRARTMKLPSEQTRHPLAQSVPQLPEAVKGETSDAHAAELR